MRGMTRKPCDQLLSEFRWSHADCSTMVGARYFPKSEARIASLDRARVANGNIAVLLAMNEENWHLAGRRGIHRGNLGEVDAVVQASISECHFDDGEK